VYTHEELIRELRKTPEQREVERLDQIGILRSYGLTTESEECEAETIRRKQKKEKHNYE
jgi:hypothetical protein